MRSPASVDLNFPESPIPPSCGWSEVTKTVRTTLLCLVVAVVAYLGVSGGESYCWIWPSIDTRYASGYSERKFRQVEVGMTETQVVALMACPWAYIAIGVAILRINFRATSFGPTPQTAPRFGEIGPGSRGKLFFAKAAWCKRCFGPTTTESQPHDRLDGIAPGGESARPTRPMKKLLLALAALSSIALAQTPAPNAAPAAAPVPPPKVDASAAIEKPDPSGKFRWAHASFVGRSRGPMDVLFLGDSITEGWTKAPHVWDHYYGLLRPANFGIGGDQTQHVIWRIENGELDAAKPKVVVLMLGTNNTGSHTAEEITAADKKIVGMIRAKIPDAKILLLGIFPRGAAKNQQGVVTEQNIARAAMMMGKITAVNAELAKLDDGKTIRYLDISPVFLGQDGKIPFTIMPDQLHPNAAGYQLWADAMQPLLTEMLK